VSATATVAVDFERALAFVLAREGGAVDDPNDKGGRTNRGITQRTYDSWRKDQGLPPADVWMATDDETKMIYRDLYWWPAKDLAWPLNLVVFDTAVLFGTGRAMSWLQAVSWHDASPQAQAWAVACFRRERHRDNVAKDKTQARFWAGWMNRLNALVQEAGI
jgi:lysozyme family protein